MVKLLNTYINSFRGLAKEVWIFALVILINRSGLMVTTYLSVYLHTDLGYSISKAGSIMMFYGAGSLLGVFVSGRISERVGYLKIQIIALVTSGFFILMMQYANTYWEFAILLFLMVFFADMYRPANMASLTQYSNFENRTRSLALIRLAINLGISIGPAVGGFLIASTGYKALFYVDGMTCIFAGLVLILLLGIKDQDTKLLENKEEEKNANLKRVDYKSFIWLLVSNFLWTMAFFQIIYTYPLFMKAELGYSEFIVGITFTLNGLLIFIMEMPIIKMYEHYNKRKILYSGTILCAISFVFLYYAKPFGIFEPVVFILPIMYMLFITIGEIFYLPFAGSMALNMAPKGSAAKFMSWYSMVFSLMHILAPFFGAFLADYLGFKTLWLTTGIMMLLVIFSVNKMSDENYERSEMKQIGEKKK